ncbi:MAG: OmpA family protein [Myxococcales bacterium]|nr:OmpA family protein [Myxococcales bacterium]
MAITPKLSTKASRVGPARYTRMVSLGLLLAMTATLPGCIAISKDAYDRDMAAMRKQHDWLEGQKRELQGQLMACQKKSAGQNEAIARCRKNGDDLKQQLQECHGKLKRIAESCGKSGILLSQCEQQLAQERAKIAALKDQNSQLQGRIAAIEARLQAMRDSFARLQKQLAALVASGKLRIVVKDGMLVIQMQSDVLFDAGKYALKDEAKPVLRDLAKVLKGFTGRRFQVAGHTDPSGGGDINWPLSAKRALSVVQFLIKDTAMPPKMLSAGGFASYLPTTANDTKENRARNRRVEFVLMPDLSKLLELAGIKQPK